jgi:hypothetical protein
VCFNSAKLNASDKSRVLFPVIYWTIYPPIRFLGEVEPKGGEFAKLGCETCARQGVGGFPS